MADIDFSSPTHCEAVLRPHRSADPNSDLRRVYRAGACTRTAVESVWITWSEKDEDRWPYPVCGQHLKELKRMFGVT